MATLKPIFPINRVVGMFLAQAQAQLELNAATQAVFPSEIYPGFTAVNEMRQILGGWYATGEGHKSFTTRLVTYGEGGGIDAVFQYNDYLRYVDIGVGAGTKAAQVQRGAKANFKSRYTSHWDRKAGRSHRPAIMMEIRHFASRTQGYLSDYYALRAEGIFLANFDQQHTLVWNMGENMPKVKRQV